MAPIKKKRTTSSILAERIKGVEGKIKEIEDIVVETVTDAIKTPKPKDGAKGEKGDPGESITGEKGDDGRPGKSIKGDRGLPGLPGASVRGEKGDSGSDGEDGLGFVTAKLENENLLIERTDGKIINAGKIKKEIIQQTIHTGGGGGGGAKVAPSKLLPARVATKELTFADSPYPVVEDDDYINVDATGGSVVINFLSLTAALAKPIYIRKNAGGVNTVTLAPNGLETIDGAATLVISSDGNAEMCVPFELEWRTF